MPLNRLLELAEALGVELLASVLQELLLLHHGIPELGIAHKGDAYDGLIFVEELILDEMLLLSGVRMDEMFLVQYHPAGSRSHEGDDRLHTPSGIRTRTGSYDAQIAT